MKRNILSLKWFETKNFFEHRLPLLSFAIFLCCGCVQDNENTNPAPTWIAPELQGHWKLVNTEMVADVPFLDIPIRKEDELSMTVEDSPWDGYTAYDLVFEKDSMYEIHFPLRALPVVPYSIDTGYVHLRGVMKRYSLPVQLLNDTLYLYRPVSSTPEYFKEAYVKTSFNDSILGILKRYGINYPELAGTWMLQREYDYDHGSYYVLNFPYSLPDSIEMTRKELVNALGQEKVHKIRTSGRIREYSYEYREPHLYFFPGKWHKGVDPMIHFIKED